MNAQAIHSTFAHVARLSQIREALAVLESRAVLGKIVLTPGS
jgi:hypothetical protein